MLLNSTILVQSHICNLKTEVNLESDEPVFFQTLALSVKWQMIANFHDTSTNILSRSFFFDLLDNCKWAVGLNAPNIICLLTLVLTLHCLKQSILSRETDFLHHYCLAPKERHVSLCAIGVKKNLNRQN